MVEFYIDSADISEIKKYSKLNIFQGVTTTPTFFFRQGITDYNGEIIKIHKIINGKVHIEAMGDNADEILKNAKKNNEIGENIISKIPMSVSALEAIPVLKKNGIKTNIHLIFSIHQAILAAQAGADYICPLLGRMVDIGAKAFEILEEIVSVIKKYGFATKVMASSIRSLDDIKKALLIGVDAITIPPKIVEMMFVHPLTVIGINRFQKDILYSTKIENLMKHGDAMPIVNDDSFLYEALAVMTEKRIGIIIVVNNENKLAGIVTDGDVRRLLKDRNGIRNIKVTEIMNSSPITSKKDITVLNALELLENNRITSFIVIDDANKPIGYINIHDIL